jgi:hypothetical protein
MQHGNYDAWKPGSNTMTLRYAKVMIPEVPVVPLSTIAMDDGLVTDATSRFIESDDPEFVPDLAE